MMNKNTAYSCRKLKRGRLIFSCFTRDLIVDIKNHFRVKSFKIHHMNISHDMFPDFNFNDFNRDLGGPPNTINSA